MRRRGSARSASSRSALGLPSASRLRRLREQGDEQSVAEQASRQKMTHDPPARPVARGGLGRYAADFRARSMHYRALAEDPGIAACAAFFSAAHLVTHILAWSHTTEFIASLSRDLQVVNDDRAQRVRARTVPVYRDWRSNTARFVRFEQRHVQLALDRLRERSPVQFLQEILLMNNNIRAAALWVSRVLSPAHEALYRAIHTTRSVLCAWPDFGRQRHRELLGFHLAIAATEGPFGLGSGRSHGGGAAEFGLRGRRVC
jgi:hypothetical protein